jgi:hypothetical protein
MTQWVPHGQIVVPDTAPRADSRMINFIGLNGGGHTGYHELRRRAGSWATTSATPSGPAELLKTSRDAYTLGYYAYSLFAVAGTWSILAVEAALKLRLDATRNSNFKSLVKRAEAAGLVPPEGWENERLDAGRQLRNRTVHGESQQLWTPAMAESVIAASHEAVVTLYPDTNTSAPQTDA